jgi:hypothetical protein
MSPPMPWRSVEWSVPLFALAVDLVFVDGRLAERERQFVDALRGVLGIDEGMAMEIIAVMLIKSRA